MDTNQVKTTDLIKGGSNQLSVGCKILLNVEFKGSFDITSEDKIVRTTLGLYKPAVRSTILNEKTVAYFISSEVPEEWAYRFKHKWQLMKAKERLLYHLSRLAEGKPFNWEIIE